MNNFDAGAGLEDVVREELERLLPHRYSVSVGIVDDSEGRTSGECDVVISNSQWAPMIKVGATESSRRVHFAVESLYAAIEVKTTATFESIDSAMEKLVCIGRLKRAANPYGHITENQHLIQYDVPERLLNPLFSVILVSRIDQQTTFEEIAKRFFAVNEVVSRENRDQMVKMLCILGGGIAYYAIGEQQNSTNADFCRDRQQVLTETTIIGAPDDVFYVLYAHLLGHLTRSVLDVLGISENYAQGRPTKTMCYGQIPRTA